jgi:hypothetical protein
MLPQTLQRAKGPTEALLEQPVPSVRGLRPGDGGAVIEHGIAGPEANPTFVGVVSRMTGILLPVLARHIALPMRRVAVPGFGRNILLGAIITGATDGGGIFVAIGLVDESEALACLR